MAGFLLLAVIAVSLYMLSTALFGGYSISTMVMEQIFTIVISLILSVFSAGFFKLHLNLCRNQPFRAGDIAYAFSHHPDRIIISAFLQSIPGFIVQVPLYAALMTYYQHPERMTNLSLKEIGKEFDNRDHTTVLHSIERIEDLIKVDPEKAEIIKDITSNINIRYE